MSYTFHTADRIFDGQRFRHEAVLVKTSDGLIIDVIPQSEAAGPLQMHKGTLSIPFVNHHCHLELSHLHGRFPKGQGLVDFLLEVVRERSASEEVKKADIASAAAALMQANTGAVVDICNTTDALVPKGKGSVQWQNCIEVINLDDAALPERWASYETLKRMHEESGLSASFSPHAPYTVSPKTFEKINEATAGALVSIHNQESAAEDELFRTGTGDFLRLYQAFGRAVSPLPVTGKSSLQSWLPYFTEGQTILLVHNTYTSEEDVQFAHAHGREYGLQLLWCLCPKANLYIEGRLPDVPMLLRNGCRLVLGTDSLASNDSLDIGEEIAVLRQAFPEIEEAMFWQWGTRKVRSA